ncbi:MAG: type II toxin-antitoxin system PemK/MazF family toxin [Chloroflexi bacterium HGW-Chloroflexi-10]|nr:MAG: type II toxin-antitoxin system PemK/MazF family toxin [Chloroflexi bacterium HGW-Chloroflexi-10]
MAVENFIRNYQGQVLPDENQHSSNEGERSAVEKTARPTIIQQGDIYWVTLGEPGITHPHVVIQDSILNRSRIQTVVVCALTSNIKRAKSPGNVLLEAGEANLPRQSIVEVSKISVVDKTQVGGYIGSLNRERVDQIRRGMQFLQATYFTKDSL